MKLLIYGGCHALIIKRLVDELGPPGRHEIDLLINFQVIASGLPFPTERLRDYDAVVYSPIENKGAYNTKALDAACAEAGVAAVRFPWLEWHGYAPTADKDVFWGHHGWFFPGLVAMARGFDEPAAFTAEARRAFPPDEAIGEAFERSSARLIEGERRAGCEVRVADFILDGFRDRRMFLIPDHPSLVLYRHVLEQLERVLGTRLIASWPRDLPEPQPEARTPILPRVAAATGLSFRDTAWCCETQPLAAMDLEAFLALHFHRGRAHGTDACGDLVVATAIRPTWIGSPARGSADPGPVAVPVFTQLLLDRADPAPARGHFCADHVADLSAEVASGRLRGPHLFRTEDWQCRS